MTLPTIRARDLNGEAHVFPDELEGPTLFLLAYARADQAVIDGWLGAAETVRRGHPGLAVYELPVLPRSDRMRAPLIDHWMRSGIPERSARGRTVTLYLDQAAFAAALGLPPGRPAAVLVRADGSVAWRSVGAADAEGLAAAVGGLHDEAELTV